MVAELKTCRKGLHLYQANLRTCPECAKVSKKKWAERNRDYVLKRKREWAEKNREKIREKSREWVKNNQEINRARARAWCASRRDYCKQRAREWRKGNPEYIKQWYQKNKEKINAYTASRRCLKLNAIPLWADLEKIKNIYKQCQDTSLKTGVLHHVDHIYPLQSKYLCGLHIETNLQILTAEENLSKSNKTWPGQLDCQKD